MPNSPPVAPPRARDLDRALRDSERFRDVLLEASPDCVKLLDLEGRLRFMNGPGRCLMEVDDFCLVEGADWASVWPGEGEATARAAVRTALGGGTGRFEGFCPTLKGTPKWWDVIVTPVRDADGAIVRLLSVSRDVTERVQAREALALSERRFRHLVERAPLGVFLAGEDGAVQYANPRLAEMAGLPGDALLAHGWAGVVHPDDREALLAAHASAAAGARLDAVRVVRPDGTARVLAVDVVRAAGEAGARAGEPTYVGTALDVTERDAMERALRANDALLAAAERVGRVGSWEFDLDSGTVRWSPELFRLSGRAPQGTPLAAEDFFDTVHPDDRDRVRRLIEGSIAAGRDYECVYRVLHPTGESRVLRGRGEMQRDARGRVTRVIGIVQDVTEQVAAEEALRASEARLRMALDVAGMIVWERDLGTDRVRHGALPSGGADALVAEDALADYAGFLAAVHPDDRERVARANADAVAHLGDFAVEYRIVGPSGATRWNQAVGRVLAGADGAPARVVGVALDVTERVTLEAQLRQSQKMEAVGQLAGGVAHDFNNLLTVISASARFARETLPADAPALEDLGAVEEAAGRAAQLTRQLLAFSRKQLLKPEALDLNAVVRRVEPLLRRLIGEDIAVVTLPASAPQCVLADPGQLEQVLVNLAVNARDAMPQGGRLVIQTAAVDVTPADLERRGAGGAPGPYVRLTVRDTGAGMDARTLAQIFEPFFTTKAPGKGTGLGLSTVYGIVKQSGGYVWVASTPGGGTAFEIDLPRLAPAEPPEAAPDAAPPAPRAARTVLVVEDEPGVRAIVRRILTREGHAVLEASDGAEALRLLDAHDGRVDLVLTDVVMPEMSGRAFAGALAARHAGIRVLFMSGYTDDEILRRGLLLPGVAFLDKPFTAERLLASVRDALADPLADPLAA